MASLNDIQHLVVVIMENRSFDHMLGYRSLPAYGSRDVDGQSSDEAWLTEFANSDGGNVFQSFHNTNPYSLPTGFDPPHQRENVSKHLGPFANGKYAMNGFAGAIPTSVSTKPEDRRMVVGYFGPDEVPINHFLAENFTICDHWFCAVPSGTQPNRLMAMSGNSIIESNATPLPRQDILYDWLDAHKISWRVYHQGLPFFALMLHWIPRILTSDNFRPFSKLQRDLSSTPPNDLPQVIFVEPAYGDAPHLGRSTDDHAPSGVSDGQEFLMQVYNAISSSNAFWKQMLTVIFYDEHGGFFDHVSPPLITTNPPEGVSYPPFSSLGPRVPAFLISPFVQAGVCAHNGFDHTSLLKLIGARFGSGSYSAEVDNRNVENLVSALSFDAGNNKRPPAPATSEYLQRRPKVDDRQLTIPPVDTELQKAFLQAAQEMKKQGGEAHPALGELLQKIPS